MTFAITQKIRRWHVDMKNEYPLTVLMFVFYSRGRVSSYHLVVDPIADTCRTENAVLPRGVAHIGPSYGISLRACLKLAPAHQIASGDAMTLTSR